MEFAKAAELHQAKKWLGDSHVLWKNRSIERQLKKDDKHPGWFIALWYLTCLEKQGKFQETLEMCECFLVSLQEIGGQGLGTKHKFATILQEEMAKLKALILILGCSNKTSYFSIHN